eukprot:2930779-Karenia_brevis.AAC.1
MVVVVVVMMMMVMMTMVMVMTMMTVIDGEEKSRTPGEQLSPPQEQGQEEKSGGTPRSKLGNTSSTSTPS